MDEVTSARDELHSHAPVLQNLQSIAQQASFDHTSIVYSTRDTFEQDYYQTYNLEASDSALRGILTGVLLERALSQQLYIPEGAGPHPGILLFHPSGGVTDAEHRWAKRLQAEGYAVYIVDSFSARGIKDRKSAGWEKAVQAQLNDIVEAYYLLSQHHAVDANRIALMGFSLGGHSVLNAMQINDTALSAAIEKLGIRTTISFYGDFTLLDTLALRGDVKISFMASK